MFHQDQYLMQLDRRLVVMHRLIRRLIRRTGRREVGITRALGED